MLRADMQVDCHGEKYETARTSASDKDRLNMLKTACTVTASVAADGKAASSKEAAGVGATRAR